MKISGFSRLTLLWKILLSTSVAITVIFAMTGWIVLRMPRTQPHKAWKTR